MLIGQRAALAGLLAALACSAPAFGQDAMTGFAGTALELTSEIDEPDAVPSHTVLCLDADNSTNIDCLLWGARDFTVAQPVTVEGAGQFLGLQLLDPAFTNPAVALVIYSENADANGFNAFANGALQILPRLSEAARVSARLAGQTTEFEVPSTANFTALAAPQASSGALDDAVEAAIAELTEFETRPRTLVVAATGTTEAMSDRLQGMLEGAQDLGIRVTVIVLPGTDNATPEPLLTVVGGMTGAALFDLRASNGAIDSASAFLSSLAQVWRIALQRTAADDDAEISVNASFGGQGNTAFTIGTDPGTVLNVGLSSSFVSVPNDFQGLVRELRQHIVWLAVAAVALVVAIAGLFFTRHRKKVPLDASNLKFRGTGADVAEDPHAETAIQTVVDSTEILAETVVATSGPASAELVFASNNRTERLPNGTFRLGRSPAPQNDIVISDSNVSRSHAQISIQNGRATIENLTLTDAGGARRENPVFVNGAQITGTTDLSNGDTIRLGSAGNTEIAFRRLG